MKKLKILVFSLIAATLLFVTVISTIFFSMFSSPHFFTFLVRHLPDPISESLPNNYLEVSKNIEVKNDIEYKSKSAENRFDLYYSKDYEEAMPTVVWVHGGFFLANDKKALKAFGTLFANEGYTFIAINYELAPEKKFPNPANQLTEVFQFLKDNKVDYPMIDFNNFIVGGDSAGAHIAGHFAAMQVMPRIAKDGISMPVLTSSQLKAVLLYCGPYDIKSIDHMGGLDLNNVILKTAFNTLVNQIGWAYLGGKNWINESIADDVDLITLVDLNYPPTYLTDGNVFSFMEHAENLETRLSELNVNVDSYYPSKINLDKRYPHEYQFNFADYHDEAMINFNKTISFLNELLK